MLTIEYIFLIFLVFFIFLVGLKAKDYAITGVSGLFLMVLGVYVISTPIEGIDQFMRNTLFVINLGLGFSISLRATIEFIKGRTS